MEEGEEGEGGEVKMGERLKLIKQDIGNNISELKKDLRKRCSKEKSIESLKYLGSSMMVFPGLVVGAVKYSPYCFAMQTFVRKGFEKEVPVVESNTAEAYRAGTYFGGALSNIAIHGGLMYHTVIKNDFKDGGRGYLIYLATLVGSNLIDHGCEYWRGLGKRVKKQEEELSKENAETQEAH